MGEVASTIAGAIDVYGLDKTSSSLRWTARVFVVHRHALGMCDGTVWMKKYVTWPRATAVLWLADD